MGNWGGGPGWGHHGGGPGFFGHGHPHHHGGGFFGPPGPHHHPGGPGYGVPGGFMGPGGYVPPGPAFAPWLGALAIGAVAASAIAPYQGRDGRGVDGTVMWREGGEDVTARVNMLTVRICQAQNLKKVQMLGKQDPYVRAKLLLDGHKIAECRSSTHTDGGRNPSWQNMRRSVFTFYVPSTVTLDKLGLVLDVINDNLVTDGLIGSTGSIALDRAATGEPKWWNVSTGGTLQAIIELVTPDSSPTHPNTAYANRNSAATAAAPGPATSWRRPTGGGGVEVRGYGGGRVATVNPSPHVAVAHARPAAATATGNEYSAPPTATATRIADPPPSYEYHTASATPANYRPPPVAPGAAPVATPTHGGGYKEDKYHSAGDYNRNAPATAAAPLPEARAVPYVTGGVAPDDPFNARGAAAAAAAAGTGSSVSPYGGQGAASIRGNAAAGVAGTGLYPSLSAYPPPSASSSYQQPQQYQQNQGNQTGRGYPSSNTRYGNM
ncbi:unnamed protein product [Scytosiphon promiscuus]